jgi:hypothetical protein
MSGTDELGFTTKIGEKIIESFFRFTRILGEGFLWGLAGGFGLVCAIVIAHQVGLI